MAATTSSAPPATTRPPSSPGRQSHRRAGLKAGQQRAGAGVVATKSTPDGVDLKLSNYSTTAAMNGSIASANNATLATVAANYGLKTVVDQHSLDIAARHAAGGGHQGGQRSPGSRHLASKLASRARGLQASKADGSALTAYALQSTVDTSSEVGSKIAAALLNAVTTAALDAALRQGGRKRAGLPALHGGRVGHAAGRRYEDSKCPAGSRHRGLRRSAAC